VRTRRRQAAWHERQVVKWDRGRQRVRKMLAGRGLKPKGER
jgi:hypothetical protein